jgi:hypothetical protein
MRMETVRCTAGELWGRPGDKFLRLENDSDDPATWHPVHTVRDAFGEFGAVTVVFADGAPEKMFNESDEVEFAVQYG